MVRRLNSLPEEIILEILARLPTESVLECKLVCKLWRDLVRQPSFSKMHLNQLNNAGDKVAFIFIGLGPREYNYTEVEDGDCDEILLSRKTRMTFCPALKNWSFLSSCNGLICLNSSYDPYDDEPAYICNPITREYIILPNLKGNYWWNGFGYSPSTNEYKVVRICFDSADPNCGVAQVYTVGAGNGWRNSGEIDPNRKNMKCFIGSTGVFTNGSLHWVNLDDGTVVAFHVTDEKFSEFPLPGCWTRDISDPLGVIGDCLSFTYNSDNQTEIWLLKKNKNSSDLSWSKEFSFNGYIQLLLSAFTKSGRLLYYLSGIIYSSDTSSTHSEEIIFDKSAGQPISHKNTLVSLKALGEKETKTMGFGERARSPFFSEDIGSVKELNSPLSKPQLPEKEFVTQLLLEKQALEKKVSELEQLNMERSVRPALEKQVKSGSAVEKLIPFFFLFTICWVFLG